MSLIILSAVHYDFMTFNEVHTAKHEPAASHTDHAKMPEAGMAMSA